MEARRILEILDMINGNAVYKKVFINGSWGIGKSYYAMNYIKDHEENFVYVSLFGKNSYEALKSALANELIDKLGKFNKSKKKISQIIEKASVSISYKGFSINIPELSKKGLITQYSELLDSKPLIIVIDDLERKSENILIKDIMGMIEEFSLFDKLKIVIIGDENNMESQDKEKWKKFKEKIIEKEYIIKDFSEDAINNLVVNKIKNYIDKKDIELFIKYSIKTHNIKNLRSIVKGINLFEEVLGQFINVKNNTKLNLILLKNCMAVAIEYTEKLYEPSDKTKEEKFEMDNDINYRIREYYFNNIYNDCEDTWILPYIEKIYKSEYTKNTIKKLNEVVNKRLNSSDDEKGIFYFSEQKITDKIKKLYNDMKENTYSFISLDDFISDISGIIVWNDNLKLNITMEELSHIFDRILLNNYYNINKTLHKNKIDLSDLIGDYKGLLSVLIEHYNNKIISIYRNDKLSLISSNFDNKNYDVEVFDWLLTALTEKDKNIITKVFIDNCRANNYFIPNISGEIDEDVWRWIHRIWDIFYTFNQEYKSELNDYINSLKINKLATYRIGLLQKRKPLV